MDWLQLIDDTLGTHFNAPVYDPQKGRNKLLKVIDTAAEQHREGKTPALRSWKLGNNGAISFSPKVANTPVLIRGKETSYVPAERFQDFLAGMRKSVEAGDLDKEIKAALDGKGTGNVGGGKATSKRSASSADKPWTARADWEQLSADDKRAVSSRYRFGKNPDNSVIAEVGHKPEAPINAARKK